MNSRAIALAALMLVSTVTVPVTAADGSSDIVEYGTDGQPSFLVTYDDGEFASLQAWAESAPGYSIVENATADNTAVVSGPRYEVVAPTLLQNPLVALGGGTIAPMPLQSRSYVQSVDPNYRHALPEPVGALASESDYEAPRSDWLVDGGFNTDGIAFDGDANQSTIGAVATDLNADQVAADGSGVRVAVLDTGANVVNGTDDPLYGQRIVGARNFVTDQPAVASNDYANVSDGNGHGSWVLSSMAANATNNTYDGIALGADYLVGKTLADDGSGSTADIVDGIYWAEAQDADLLSMSLGSAVYDESLADALRHFVAGNGTAAFIAVGNSRMTRPAQIASPSDVPEPGIVSVAATNATNASQAGPAYFSQTGSDNGYSDLSSGTTRGAGPDIAGPGMRVTVPVFSADGYRRNETLSGTSMSTPIVAAVGTLSLDARPDLENDTDAFVSAVTNTTRPIPLAGTTEVGAGMVDAAKLVADNTSGTSQTDARTEPAQRRDQANRSLGLDWRFQALRRIQVGI
ncbi:MULTISPECIES: S8 family peptidase [Salinibaculum]|uniref:S8 family peptidase n=1 Tax=Salinibaculum TaxID=2732368 RepID=UPI0030CF8DDC